MIRTGTIERTGDAYRARLVRDIEHAPATVWHMLVAPEALVNWLAPGCVDAQPGGSVRLDFEHSGTAIDSTVYAFEPHRVLEYSWSDRDGPLRPLRWELTPTAMGTRLTLTLRIPATEDIAKAAAGWDAHLEMLRAALEDVPIRFPADHFRAARSAYGAQLPKLTGGIALGQVS